MKSQALDRDQAPFPLAAVLNARMHNSVNRTLYSNKQIAKATGMFHCLEQVYSGKFYMNYRKKFIVLKVDGTVRNKAGLKMLESGWETEAGIVVTKHVTPQGRLYRVYFV